MHDLLRTNENGSPNFDCRLITSAPDVTKVGLKAAIETLFARETEIALLYFSGHGFLDEKLGGYLVTSDAKSYDEGVSMADILSYTNQSSAEQAVIILDCCYSGAFGSNPTLPKNEVFLANGRSVLTASTGDETAMEVAGHGVFTRLICDALSGGAADVLGKVTAASAYAYVDEVLDDWNQRPLFKTNVSRLKPLRLCKSQLAVELLRELAEHFQTADYVLPLNPSFEPDLQPSHPENERIFGHLQKLRASRLVEVRRTYVLRG